MTSKINFKKIWALLIALVIMVSVFSICVFAQDDVATTTAATEQTTTAGSETTTSSGETTTSGSDETTSGSGSTTTTGGTTSGDDSESKPWVVEHLNFVIALGIIVLLVVLYFALRLFVPSFREKTSKFWKDYNAEFKKLVWPTKQQLIKNSAAVLVTMIVFAAVFILLDTGLAKGMLKLKDLVDQIRPVS